MSPLFVQRVPMEPVASFERTAQARQPQIARLRAMVAQAEQGVRVQQAKLKPQIFAFGQYDFRRRDEMLTDPDWAFGIGLKYTFLSPNSLAQISAARAQQDQAEAGLREAENQVALGVRKAWNELETARQQFVLLDSSIAQAQENLRLQELAFREGQATSLDVIDARLGWAAPVSSAHRPPTNTTLRWHSCWRSVDRWTVSKNSGGVRTR